MSNLVELIVGDQGGIDLPRFAESLEHTGRIRTALIQKDKGVHLEAKGESNFQSAESVALACGNLVLAVIRDRDIDKARKQLDKTNEQIGKKYQHYEPTSYYPVSPDQAVGAMRNYLIDLDFLVEQKKNWFYERFLSSFSRPPAVNEVTNDNVGVFGPLSLDYLLLQGARMYASQLSILPGSGRWNINLGPAAVSPDSEVIVFPRKGDHPLFYNKEKIYILDENPVPIFNLGALTYGADQLYTNSTVYSASRR